MVPPCRVPKAASRSCPLLSNARRSSGRLDESPRLSRIEAHRGLRLSHDNWLRVRTLAPTVISADDKRIGMREVDINSRGQRIADIVRRGKVVWVRSPVYLVARRNAAASIWLTDGCLPRESDCSEVEKELNHTVMSLFSRMFTLGMETRVRYMSPRSLRSTAIVT